jgi:hypothetical protein
MKRVLSKIAGVLRSAKFKKLALVVLIFALGAVAGSLATKALIKDSVKSSSPNRSASPISSEERSKRSVERLEESYKRSKDRIKKDVEAKRLTQDKADKITAKLDEIYNYKKENLSNSSDASRGELQDKRKEWRDWVEQNDVSSRYFIGVI